MGIRIKLVALGVLIAIAVVFISQLYGRPMIDITSTDSVTLFVALGLIGGICAAVVVPARRRCEQ